MVRLSVRILPQIAAGLAAGVFLLAGGAAQAETLTATPATIGQVIEAARPGQAVTLQPGDYPVLKIANHAWSPEIVVDAHAATFPGIVMKAVTGVSITGGKIAEPTGTGYGVLINDSHQVAVEAFDIVGARVGIVVSQSTDVKILDNAIHDNRTDGIDAPSNQRVTISGNRCFDFHPNPATYNPDGSLLQDGDHPDCIQIWSRPGAIAQDYVINGNSANGSMQGISGFNHIRNGVDDGGFDRITITGNKLMISAPNGIVFGGGLGCRDCIARDNVVETIPGSTAGRPTRRFVVKANMRVSGPGAVACGNTIPAVPNNPAAAPCR